LGHVEFREGLAEELPIQDGWADVVISNGVLNLVADKDQAFAEIYRVLRPGGHLQFADIAVGRPVPADAVCNIDLWTDCIAGGLSCDGWREVMRVAGFTELEIGPPVDAFDGAGGEANARRFEVFGYPFLAHKPPYRATTRED
jgi:SAM-dependent methyltransferase